METPRQAWHWTALIGLWTLVAAVVWVVSVQAFLVLMSPTGHWQGFGVAHVTVTAVDPDPNSQLTDNVTVQEGDEERDLRMLKTECREIHTHDQIWILDNYWAGGLRPDHFRLTPQRLLLEFPEPILLLAFWGIWRIRKAQAKAQKQQSSGPRKVWRDEFHLRADRFAKDEKAEKP
jgi:hypothetical protein